MSPGSRGRPVTLSASGALQDGATEQVMPSRDHAAEPVLPEVSSLAGLNAIIAGSAPLVPGATQAVLGEGPQGAAIAFVGEQAGRSGR